MRLFSLPALAVCAAGLLFSQVASAQSKVGVINFQKALLDTKELTKASADLTAKFKPRADALEKLQRELADLQTQLQGSAGKLSPQGQADLEARGRRKQTEAQRIQDDLQSDVDNERNAVLQKSGQRMTDLIKKIAEEKGLDIVVDVQSTYFFKPVMDITVDATAAYDKAFPVK